MTTLTKLQERAIRRMEAGEMLPARGFGTGSTMMALVAKGLVDVLPYPKMHYYKLTPAGVKAKEGLDGN